MKINVIGGGLAGSEAACQLLKRGYEVDLFEMRGGDNTTPAHKTDKLAELVCSNSLKSISKDTGHGLLKLEMQKFGSLLLECAFKCAVPAGGALAVDREAFSNMVEDELAKFEKLNIIRKEVIEIDTSIPTIVASGPLTSEKLSLAINKLIGEDGLNFFDAIAPIVDEKTIDFNKAFFAARYDKGGDDYINCPMNKEEYLKFYNELINAEKASLHDFDLKVFEHCMPIEVMASRGEDTMRFGPDRKSVV